VFVRTVDVGVQAGDAEGDGGDEFDDEEGGGEEGLDIGAAEGGDTSAAASGAQRRSLFERATSLFNKKSLVVKLSVLLFNAFITKNCVLKYLSILYYFLLH
jgi:hypothetical protein